MISVARVLKSYSGGSKKLNLISPLLSLKTIPDSEKEKLLIELVGSIPRECARTTVIDFTNSFK